MNRLVVSEHAVEQFRARWPYSSTLNDGEIRRLLRDQVGTEWPSRVRTPTGDHVQVTYAGDDGYAVVKENEVVTVLPKAFCPEVNEVYGGR
jgi:hypothetical protein